MEDTKESRMQKVISNLKAMSEEEREKAFERSRLLQARKRQAQMKADLEELQMIEWCDFKALAWEPTESFQLRYVLDDVELTLMDEDMAGNAEIMVQSFGARKLSQRSIRFPLPVSPKDYDTAIATVEGWHSISLPDLKWSAAHPADEAEDDDEEPDDGIPRLKFDDGECSLIQGKLMEAVRGAMKSRNLPAEDLMNLGAILWLLERLPVHLEEYTGILTLSSSHSEGSGWRTMTLSEEDGLSLEYGEIIRGDYGSDQFSKTIFKATPTRCANWEDSIGLEDWLCCFARDVAESDYALSVEWFPEGEMPGSV